MCEDSLCAVCVRAACVLYRMIECYAGPPCTARLSDRVRVLALKQPVYLPLPGRAERVAKGHMVAGLPTVGVCLVILRILL